MRRSVIFTSLAGAAAAIGVATADDANAQTFGGGNTPPPTTCGSNCDGGPTPPVSPPCDTFGGGCGPTTPPPEEPNPGNPVTVDVDNSTDVDVNNSADADANAAANATVGDTTSSSTSSVGNVSGGSSSANNSFNYRESRVANTAIATVGAGFCAGGAIGVQTFWAGVSGSRGVRMTCVDAVNSSNEVVTAIANGDACERAIAISSNERMANSLHENYPGGMGAFITERCAVTVTYNDVAETPAPYAAPVVPAEPVVREVPRRVVPSPRVVD